MTVRRTGVADRVAPRTVRQALAGDADPYKSTSDARCYADSCCRKKSARLFFGVDMSLTMLMLTGTRLGDTPPLLKTAATRIPLSHDSVDLAYTVTVLQHNVESSHMQAMVSELARVSRGEVVLMEDLVAPDQPAARGDS